jgi:hypothetical protein
MIDGAVTFGAVLPDTERGKTHAVTTLPAWLEPPIVVRLFSGSPATPTGAWRPFPLTISVAADVSWTRNHALPVERVAYAEAPR